MSEIIKNFPTIKQMIVKRIIKPIPLNDKITNTLLGKSIHQRDILKLKAGKMGLTQLREITLSSPERAQIVIGGGNALPFNQGYPLEPKEIVSFHGISIAPGETCTIQVQCEDWLMDKDIEFTCIIHYEGELEVLNEE